MPIFPTDDDRRAYIATLRRFAQECAARIHAYCLMSTHFHLLVEVAGVSLSRFMHRVLQVHAQYINFRYGFCGHVFGDRFWSKPCERDAYLLEVVRYIHMNPVEAGIVRRPDDYPWSSHRDYLSLDGGSWVATDSVLGLIANDRAQAVREYATLMAEGLRREACGFE